MGIVRAPGERPGTLVRLFPVTGICRHLTLGRDFLELRGFPLLHGSHLLIDSCAYSGSAKTMSASPRGAPNISGANPSTQAPNPVGTAIYCLPSML
jgi:hypothetical protein